MKNKVAWVAGAGRGIGRAIALRLSEEGAIVVVGSRTKAERDAVAGLIRERGGVAHALPLDVASRDSVDAFAEAAVEETGGTPEIAVYCSGMNFRKPADEYPEEQWLRVLDVNLNGAFRFCQATGRRMIAGARGGSIVTITSMLSHVVTPNQSAYAASKGALLQYTKVLAVEWAKHNIRVNSVSPGYIATAINAGIRKEASFTDNVLAKTPLGRFGTPEEIADTVAYLAGPRATFVTGADFVVDGGFLAGHPAIVAKATS